MAESQISRTVRGGTECAWAGVPRRHPAHRPEHRAPHGRRLPAEGADGDRRHERRISARNAGQRDRQILKAKALDAPVQLLDFCRFLTYFQMKTIMSMNNMTEAELKLSDEKLRAEVAKLIAETGQIGVSTFLAPFLAAAGLMGATAALTAALVKLLF